MTPTLCSVRNAILFIVVLFPGWVSPFTTISKNGHFLSSVTPTVKRKQYDNNINVSYSRISSSKDSEATTAKSSNNAKLDVQQEDFILGYLNKHHGDLLIEFAKAFSEIGSKQAKQNAFSGGSYTIEQAKIVSIDSENLGLEVQINIRGKKDKEMEKVTVNLDAEPIPERKRALKYSTRIQPITRDENLQYIKCKPIDDVVRRLNRLCFIVNMPEVTGKLIQLAIQCGGNQIGKLPENLYLNQVPHNRYVRKYFYDTAASATLDACILCSKRKVSNRMELVSLFPEMNPSMDSYRIGTILELVRTVAIKLAEQNLRVRICVQGSMGVGIFTGVPKQLNGVSKLLQMMDWQSGPGEENEGMVGNYINFGNIGKEHVVDEHTSIQTIKNEDGTEIKKEVTVNQDDVFLLIAPQSMVGIESSIILPLQEMVEAAGDRPVILINPDLTDKVSSQGQQSVRGRQDRIDFANSFETIYHYQNIYVSGTSYFPILGSICKLSPYEPWVAHQRRDTADGKEEIYVPILSSETKPEGEVILTTFER